jgi:hypothetical protein
LTSSAAIPKLNLPDVALSRFERPKSMLAQPRVVNRRKRVPLWQPLWQAGIPSTILRCPCTCPPETVLGRMLAGVGVPDLRGSQSKGTFYTQDKTVAPQENEQLVYLDSGAEITSRMIGLRNTRVAPAADTFCEIRVRADKAAGKLAIQAGGTPAKIEVPTKSWSEWVRFKFKLSLLRSVSGIARFYVRPLEPHVELYVSAINFDPAAPMFQVSAPGDYARELSEKIGLFSTLGMAEDHNGLNNGTAGRSRLSSANVNWCSGSVNGRCALSSTASVKGCFSCSSMRVQHVLWQSYTTGWRAWGTCRVCRNSSFALSGLLSLAAFTKGLRPGLHSCAAPRPWAGIAILSTHSE